MMKRLCLFFWVLGFYIPSFCQKFIVSNDSLTLTVSPIMNLSKDSIKEFDIELVSRYSESISIGSYSKNTPSSFIYTIGNKIIILFGGGRPGLIEPPEEWVELISVRRNDTIKYRAPIRQLYANDLVLSRCDFDKYEKTFVVDYLVTYDHNALPYKEFQVRKKQFT